MKIFYSIMLWCAEFELALARSAPVRNPRNIEACSADVARWELALFNLEWKYHG